MRVLCSFKYFHACPHKTRRIVLLRLLSCWIHFQGTAKCISIFYNICIQMKCPLSHRRRTCAWWRHQMEIFSTLVVCCVGNSSVTCEFPSKGKWRAALVFFFICACTNDCANNRYAADLRRHCAYYDVTITAQVLLREEKGHPILHNQHQNFWCPSNNRGNASVDFLLTLLSRNFGRRTIKVNTFQYAPGEE